MTTTYLDLTRPTVDQSAQVLAQDLIATESTIREALSKIALTLGKNVVREPPVDIYDEGDRIVVMVDMPGIQRENIKVRVSIDSVEISAAPSASLNNGRPIKTERFVNFKLYRKITLPCKVKISEARAYLKDGVLYIYLPKLMETSETVDLAVE